MDYVDRVTSKGTVYEISDSEAREVKLDKKDLPTNLSQFKNDIGAIDNTVSNLQNYYLKSETYTRDEIKDLLSNRLRYLVVSELPTGDFDRNVIYLIARKSGEEGESDVYDEYLYISGEWELIGNTFVDLSDYYRKAEIEAVTDEKIAVETTARENADDVLNEKLAALLASLNEVDERLNDEKARAEYAENQNRAKAENAIESIERESIRAKGVENELNERAAKAEAHIEDYNNPHNVTAAQIGLENVVNVGLDDTPMLYSRNGVSSDGVFSALLGKVDKVDGKSLSDENFSFAEKTKLENLENYDDTALSERISANEEAIATLNADSDTEGSVDAKIKAAVESITQFDFKIVDALPDIAEAKKGVIYLIPESAENVQPAETTETTEPQADTTETTENADSAQNDTENAQNDVPETVSEIPETNSEQENGAGNEENAQSEIPESNSDISESNNEQESEQGNEENGVSDTENAQNTAENDHNERYSEYIFIDGRYEHLGNKTVEMELSEYAKKNEVTALVSVKNDKIGIEDADDTALTDTDTLLSAESGSGITAFLRHPLKKLWAYVARKIADELGLTAAQYGGNAKTATTATYATNLGNSTASYTKASLDTALNAETSARKSADTTLQANIDKIKAQTSALTVFDTRNDNQTPQWYMSTYPRRVVWEFKNSSAIGISSNLYVSLETIVQWSDSSGNYPTQYARQHSSCWVRHGTSLTTWSSWVKVH